MFSSSHFHWSVVILVFAVTMGVVLTNATAETVVVDDKSDAFSVTGTWTEEGPSNQSHAMSFRSTGSSPIKSAQAVWSSQLKYSDDYTVSVWHTDGSDRCSEVKYTIEHFGGVQSVTVDQTVNGAQWIDLGTFPFSNFTPAKVTLSNQSSETGKYIIADAVRFAWTSSNYDALYQGAWVYSWGTGFLSESQTIKTINDARDYNINCLFPEIRKTGDAYYLSETEPRATNIAGDYPDPLADFLTRAHDTSGGKQYIEVHAWMVPFRVWNSANTPPAGHVLLEHPDWVTYKSAGDPDSGVLDPGIPEVQDYLVDVFVEVVEKYNVDGIHYDYIRYLGQDAGYNPVSLARFQKLYNRSDRPAPDDSQWSQFRRDQISDLVRKAYARMKQVRWDVKVSASTITWLPSPPEGDFTRTRAYYDIFQDWPEMMREGSLDLNCPMNYMRDHNAAQHAGFRGWTDFAASVNYGRHTIIGPGTYMNYIHNSINQMNYARDKENIVGNNIYRYGAACLEGNDTCFWRTAKGSVFDAQRPIPEAEWLSRPTQGIVCGTVTDLSGNPIDGATVVLGNGDFSGSLKSDGTGFFAFLRMDPGTDYSVTAQVGENSETTTSFDIAAGQVTEVTVAVELPTATPTSTPTITPTPTVSPTATATPTLAGDVTIVDDDAELENQIPGWTTVGFEESSWGSGFYDGDKHFALLDYPPDATFEWNFGSVAPGLYEIYVWTQGTNLDQQADYQIESVSGYVDVTRGISQHYPIEDNGWRDVIAGGSMLYLDGPTTLTLDNSNENSGGNSLVYADACRLVGPIAIECATLPFMEDFEDPFGLAGYWRSTGTGQYRTEISGENDPHRGNYHLVMDDTTNDSNYSRNELTLAVDLSDKEQVKLNFWAKDISDESHTPDTNPFYVGSDFDGIAISQDGYTWYEVQSLTGYTSRTYFQFDIDLDAEISRYGLQYTDSFLIRFNHYDNYSTTTDGYAFDDISLTGIVADDLKVTPMDGFTSRGVSGYYCKPQNYVITLTNAGDKALDWEAELSCDWLSISSSSGKLQATDGIDDILVNINENYKSLPAGTCIESITFTNKISGKERIVPVKITLYEPEPPVYFDFDEIISPVSDTFSVSVGVSAIESNGFQAVIFDNTAEISATKRGVNSSPEILITECVVGAPDGMEIQNISGAKVDTNGWIVAVGDDRTDLNDVHTSLWYLPEVMEPGEILYHDENNSVHDWSSNVNWINGRQGWAMIINDNSQIVDFVCWGADAVDINAMAPVINDQIVTVSGFWTGDGISTDDIESLQRIGTSDSDSAADFINRDIGSINVQNTGLTVPFPGMREPISVLPTTIGPFTQGRWEGTVVFAGAANGIALAVQDASGTFGQSGKFDIIAQLTPTPTDTPVNETPSVTPTQSPTDTPTVTNTFTPTNTPTSEPTSTPTPTSTPEDGGYLVLDAYGGVHLQGAASALAPDPNEPAELFPYFFSNGVAWEKAVDIEILPDRTTRKELTAHGIIWTIVKGATTTQDWTYADFSTDFGKYVSLKSSGGGNGIYLLDIYGNLTSVGDANPALGVNESPFPGGSLIAGVTDPELLLRAVDFEVNASEDTAYVLDSFGGVHVVGAGSMQSLPYFGWDIARDLEFFTANEDICLLDGFGSVHPASGETFPVEFSGTLANTVGLAYFGWDIARDLEFTPDFMSAWVLDGLGPAHMSGHAPYVSGLWFGWDAAVDLEIYLDETQFE